MEVVMLTSDELSTLNLHFLEHLYRDGWTMENEGSLITFYR